MNLKIGSRTADLCKEPDETRIHHTEIQAREASKEERLAVASINQPMRRRSWRENVHIMRQKWLNKNTVRKN